MGPDGGASVAVEIDDSDVRVVVIDTGGGISPDDLEHVLDPFFSTKAEGTGLALPIARQIAAAHGRLAHDRECGWRRDAGRGAAAAGRGAVLTNGGIFGSRKRR